MKIGITLLSALLLVNTAMAATLYNKKDIPLILGPEVKVDDMEAYIILDCTTPFKNCGNGTVDVSLSEKFLHVPKVTTFNYYDSPGSWNPLFYQKDFTLRPSQDIKTDNPAGSGGLGIRIVSGDKMDAIDKPIIITKILGGNITIDLSQVRNLKEENEVNIHLWTSTDPTIRRMDSQLIRWTRDASGMRFKLSDVGADGRLTVPVKDLIIASTDYKVLKLHAYIQDGWHGDRAEASVAQVIELPLELNALSIVPVLEFKEIEGQVPEFKY